MIRLVRSHGRTPRCRRNSCRSGPRRENASLEASTVAGHSGRAPAGGTASVSSHANAVHAVIEDPLRQWMLSPMDIESYKRWYDYSRARHLMLENTHSKHAP
jgi:hypothetical protein